MADVFQERYLKHQERKQQNMVSFLGEDGDRVSPEERAGFFKVLENRRSQRKFINEKITNEEYEQLLYCIKHTPSSCNRQAVYIKKIDPVDAEQLLVGGRGWSDKADIIILLFANREAYKSPNEKGFMPYLDGGFVGQSVCLGAEALNIGSCFINPNIREENKERFNSLYNPNDDYFCGAIALGHYDMKARAPEKREVSEIEKE